VTIIVAYAWHDSNKGDAAILEGSLKELRDGCKFAGQIVVIPSIHPSSSLALGMLRHNAKTEALAVSPPSVPAFPRHKLDWIWQIPRALLKLIEPRLLPSRPDESAIEQAGGVILTGGLYLAFPHRSPFRLPFRLFAYLYPALYGKRLGKPVILFGHSLGPFENGLSWVLMKLTLQGTVLIARESKSAELAKRLAGDKVHILVAPDPAFGVRPHVSPLVQDFLQTKGLSEESFIAFVPRGLRGYGWSADEERAYVANLAFVAKSQLKRGRRVVFVAHTQGPTLAEDDRIIVKEIQALLGERGVDWFGLEEDPSPAELAYLYSKASVVVTTRFHGAVLSLLSGTPTIVVPYFGTKAQGVFEDLGLQDFILDIRNPQFATKLEALLEETYQKYTLVKERFRQVAETSSVVLRKVVLGEICPSLGG
jgi:polysaccharide pyruvyl transferase WcaK-like protein